MAENTQKPFARKLARWMKIVIMFLSFGFVFPHVLTEDEDMEDHDPQAAVKK